MNTEQLILSVGTILLAARVLGWIFQPSGQPHVVGEMIAGIALEPSLLGRFFPGAVLTALVHSAQSWQRFAVTLFFLLAVVVTLVPIRRAATLLESGVSRSRREYGFVSSWFSSCSRPVGRPNGWFTNDGRHGAAHNLHDYSDADGHEDPATARRSGSLKQPLSD